MKVLIIHNKYKSFSGEEAVVDTQIKLLEENGHTIITYFKHSKDIEKEKFGKAKAFYLALKNSSVVNELREILKEEKPDIVHIHNLYPLISPAILPEIKKFRIPIVMSVHNYRLICPNGLFFDGNEVCEKCSTNLRELNCILNNCESSLSKSSGYALRNFWARKHNYYTKYIDKYLCLTQFQAEKLILNGFDKDKCAILPNCFTKDLEKIDSKYFNESKNSYVAFAGRLSREKGIHILFEAARMLPDIKFHLAGHSTEEFIQSLGTLPENIILKGLLNKDELQVFYQNAFCFVLPSIWYEGFPMVFPEAMAYELPCIAPNFAAYPEIINNNTGLLFDFKNPISLAKQIEFLWKNKEIAKKYGQNGRLKVQKEYTTTVYYKKLISSYNDVIL